MKEIYLELLNVFDKYDQELKSDYEVDIRSKLKSRIRSYEIASKFNIELPLKSFESYGDYLKLDENRSIGLWGEKYRRTISWSDDGKQPEDEWLYVISFSTGAYIFNGAYPSNTFNQFFNELKTYSPKYIDTTNHYLFFDESTAKLVNDSYKDIFKKYKELAKKEVAESQIKELELKLSKLKDVKETL